MLKQKHIMWCSYIYVTWIYVTWLYLWHFILNGPKSIIIPCAISPAMYVKSVVDWYTFYGNSLIGLEKSMKSNEI